MTVKCGIWHYGKNGNKHNDTNHYDTCNNDNQYNRVKCGIWHNSKNDTENFNDHDDTLTEV